MAQPQQKVVPFELTELAAVSPQKPTPQPKKAIAPPPTPQDSRPHKAETPQVQPKPATPKPKPSSQPVAKPKPKPKPKAISKAAVAKPKPQAHPLQAKAKTQPKPLKTLAKATPKPERQTATTHQAATTPASKQPAAAPNPPAATSSTPAVDPGIKRRYLEALRRTIAQLAQDSYPYRARRRGQQGTVTLSFTIHADGRITNLIQTGSSGHALLDEAARRVIEEDMNMRFQPFPKGLNLEQLQVTIPLRYQLR